MTKQIKIKNESGFPLDIATDGSLGFDLRAVVGCYLQPQRRMVIDTGIRIELPDDWGAYVMPRSGMGANHGIVPVLGVVDRDYRGRIGVNLIHHGAEPHAINIGDRIAQLVLLPTPRISIVLVDELSDTARGGGGFGSTGR